MWRPWRAAALGAGAAALPYLALLGDSMMLFFAAALLGPVGWALSLRAAWSDPRRSRRLVLWLFVPVGLAAVFPLVATVALYTYWYYNGFGS